MKIIVAPQAFKNCATAGQVARAISCGAQRSLPKAEVINVPIADGGDSTLQVLLNACHGKRHTTEVNDAFMNRHKAEWAVIDGSNKIAVIESALVCGMAIVPKENLNPLTATSYGVGELIKKVMSKDQRKIFIGIGGSATNDGGTGLATALGAKFLDADGKELPLGGAALASLAHIDISGLDERLKKSEIIVGCDVNIPLLGSNGATHIFSPQKGATPEMTAQLEAAMLNFTAIVQKDLGIDIGSLPFGGAAGGMGCGLHVFCKGRLVGGAAWILDKIGFKNILQGADLLIISEGRMDGQTANDKGPLAAAKIARSMHIPIIAIVGTTGPGVEKLKSEGIEAIYPSTTNQTGIPEDALSLIEHTTEQALKNYANTKS